MAVIDIFLVRHGEASASWGEDADPGLSELGRQQAQSVAAYLEQRIGRDCTVISSPLRRAIETAAPLEQVLGIRVTTDAAFREIPSPVPLSRRQAWLRDFMQQQWQEQAGDLIAWRRAALEQLLALTQPAVVFSHFLVINAVVGQVLARDETLCFWPDNGSVTHLTLSGGGLQLVSLGKEMQTTVN